MDHPTRSATTPHAIKRITTLLNAVSKRDQDRIAEHVARLLALPAKKRDAIMTLGTSIAEFIRPHTTEG